MRKVTEADREAVRRLLGCEHPNQCDWVGIVLIQHRNRLGKMWRSCREHAAPFGKNDEYMVIDTGHHNRRIPTLHELNGTRGRIVINSPLLDEAFAQRLQSVV